MLLVIEISLTCSKLLVFCSSGPAQLPVTVQYSTVQCSAVQCSAVQYSTVQYLYIHQHFFQEQDILKYIRYIAPAKLSSSKILKVIFMKHFNVHIITHKILLNTIQFYCIVHGFILCEYNMSQNGRKDLHIFLMEA